MHSNILFKGHLKKTIIFSVFFCLSLLLFLSPARGAEESHAIIENLEKSGGDCKSAINWTERALIIETRTYFPENINQSPFKRAMGMRQTKFQALKYTRNQVPLDAVNIRINSDSTINRYTEKEDSFLDDNSWRYYNFFDDGFTMDFMVMSDQCVKRMILTTLVDGIEARYDFPLNGTFSEMLINELKKEYPLKTPSWISEKGNGESFSGLIVDCSHIRVNPSIFFNIYNKKGDIVYGMFEINKDTAIKNGMCLYTKKENPDIIKKVGESPLKVKALNAKGKESSDVIISDQNSQKIRQSMNREKWIKDSKIVLILSDNWRKTP